MNLILKEYLASLKERDELDAILPDLLRQMGLTVYGSPRRGVKEYGVDIGAVGSIDEGTEKVYLLSVKSGDLTRDMWNGASNQSLRPSLDEILDSYIPTRIPPEHKGKPIEICLCFGGEVHSVIRQDVTGYTARNSKHNITFSEWNGDKIADFILKYFFTEDLAPNEHRSLLRKSIAMLDVPDVSIKYYKKLINQLCEQNFDKKKNVINVLRQLNIYSWMLFAWGREDGNIESAYVCSEYALLKAWDISKKNLNSSGKDTEVIRDLVSKLIKLNLTILDSYINKIVEPASNVYLGLSSMVSPSCSVDVNLKLFDLVGRVALFGVWNYQQSSKAIENYEYKESQNLYGKFLKTCDVLIKMIDTNDMLVSPYKDDQAIDVMMAVFCLSLSGKHTSLINEWLKSLVNLSIISYRGNQKYLTNIQDYEKLIRHPEENTKEYREKVIKGSILFPNLAVVASIFGFQDIYDSIQQLHSEFLTHANIQLYFFNEDSEKYLYNDSDLHGSTWSDVNIQQKSKNFLNEVVAECKESNHIWDLSAINDGLFPIVLLACRHHRMPFPIHFLV